MKTTKTTLLRRWVALGSALVWGLGFATGVADGQRVALRQGAAAMPAAAVDQGLLQPATPMQLTVYLQPSAERVAALKQYLVALQSAGDPAYRHWLTPAQFGAQFGATADQMAGVAAWARTHGVSVGAASASGLSLAVSGTAAQVEAALSPSLHAVQVSGKLYVANVAVPSVDAAIAPDVVAIDGLNSVPSAHPLAVAGSGYVAGASNALAAVEAAVDANVSRVLSLSGTSGTSCVEDVDAASQAAMQLLLEQASAQGMTVLSTSGCGARGAASYPAMFGEVTSIAASPGVTPPTNPSLTTARPAWQIAKGLPADGFRHEPDLTSDVSALAATLTKIMASFPVAKDGSPARLGNVNAILYQLAPMKGLYTQPYGAAAGTWEAATGLGQVDLQKLEQFFPRGSLATYVSIDAPPYYANHGSTFTFTSTVKDTSGQGNGAVPGGTVTFKVGSSITLGPVALVNGTAQTTSNQLPGGTYGVTANYSGDANYAGASSSSESITLAPEAATLAGAAISTPAVGGTLAFAIAAKSASGVGTPSAGVLVHPTTADFNSTYTGKLSGTGDTGSAVISVPAVQAGKDEFVIRCDDSDPSFTCTQTTITATINKATPAVTFTYSPNPPVQGQTVQFVAKVLGAGGKAPVPSGNVNFSNNGVDVAPATLQADGTATSNPTVNFNYSASGNNFTASYGGDNNYNSYTSASTTSGTPIATTTTVNVSPTTIALGSPTNFVATITPAQTGSAALSGTVNFTSGATKLCGGTVSGGAAACSAAFSATGTPSAIVATYSGDTNYAGSASTNNPQVTVTKGSSKVDVTATPATPLPNQATTFTAAVSASMGTSSVPFSGNVTFYVNGTAQMPSALSNGQATFSATLGTGPASVYGVYAGDSNWNGSQSATLNYTVGSTSTGSGNNASALALTANTNFATAGSNIVLTATLTPTSGSTATSAFTGSVTFYDLFNGQSAALGASSVTSSSSASGVASWTTSGLKQGTHVLTAVYSGDSIYAPQTSAPFTLNLSDYSITFAPASLTLTSGSSASTTATITPLASFNGTVPLVCLPPAGSAITCSFSPTSVAASGTSTLTVTTQSSLYAMKSKPTWLQVVGGSTLACVMFGLLVPRRRRRGVAFVVTIISVALMGLAGCTNLTNAGGGNLLSSGTAPGTYNLTISSAGTDKGGTTVTHSLQFQVIVQ